MHVCIFGNVCCKFKCSGFGKYPNSTSPNYWGYNLQQIFEGGVQNPPKKDIYQPLMLVNKTTWTSWIVDASDGASILHLSGCDD